MFDTGFINSGWVLYNISLALVGDIFGLLIIQTKSRLLKIIYGIIWILFLPNTIYLLTDIEHLPNDLQRVMGIMKIISSVEYFILTIIGVVTFLIGMYPIEKMLKTSKNTRHQSTIILIITNFFIAFGMVLGRTQRINSWDVFFNASKVLNESLYVISSQKLLLLFLFFAALCNILYFYCRKFVVKNLRIT